ncbi:hypothetical protein C8J56DRAFT_768374 [Mycena floridula]|nr:hypothetical protein C8J56DRAFT_768374 [Mycena floridula]
MFTNNPYQVWSHRTGNEPTPSILGALPFTSSSPWTGPTTFITFTFTFNLNILNCVVFGPGNVVHYEVKTSQSPGNTLFEASDGRNFAGIEWRISPTVEVQGSVQKQTVSQWIGASEDRSYRSMYVLGQWYRWVPREYLLCLYKSSSSDVEELVARVSRQNGSVSLDIAVTSVRSGFVEACIVAVALLQCGRRID